jgi:hypothetical protein
VPGTDFLTIHALPAQIDRIGERRLGVDNRITPRSKAYGGFRAVGSRQINQKSATLEG